MKMIKLVTACLLVVGTLLMAESVPAVTKNVVPPGRARDVAQLFASQGGVVQLESGNKTLLVAYTDDDVPESIGDTLAKIEIMLKLPLSRRQVKVADNPYRYAKSLQTTNTPAVVLFHSCKDEPSLAVFPEEGIACVNVSIFRGNGDTLLKDRLSKEMWRAVGLALGGYGTINGGCVLQPAFTVNQLDAIQTHTLGPMRVNGVFIGANKLGLPTRRMMSYAQACRMGIAPAPTNDLQRTIWHRFQADKERGPTNAIKITPPTKK